MSRVIPAVPDRLMDRTGVSYFSDGPSIVLVSTELTRRRAVDLLRVATALCLPS